MLASENLIPCINSFQVHDPSPYSIHCMISCNLATKFDEVLCNDTLHPLPPAYKWKAGDETKYFNALSTPTCAFTEQFMKTSYGPLQKDIDFAVVDLNNIFYT
jgi:hypothetical protein